MERTLILVKPDGVARGLAGEVIGRFERRGLRLGALKLLRMSREKAEAHYAEHRGKPFFADLLEYIGSGPVVAAVLYGENAVSVVRAMLGSTNCAAAAPGTIRGDFGLSMQNNILHGSDSIASAEREIALYFSLAEIVGPAQGVADENIYQNR